MWFSLNVSRLETQQEPIFQFKLKGQEKTNVPIQRHSTGRNSLLLVGGSAFLFYSGLRLIRWGPPTLERARSLLSLPIQILISFEIPGNTLTDTQIMFDQMSGHLTSWTTLTILGGT